MVWAINSNSPTFHVYLLGSTGNGLYRTDIVLRQSKSMNSQTYGKFHGNFLLLELKTSVFKFWLLLMFELNAKP